MNILENIMEIIENFILQMYEYLNLEEDDFDAEPCNCSSCMKNK